MKRTTFQVLAVAVVAMWVPPPTAGALVVKTEGKVVFDAGGFEDGVAGVFPFNPSVGTYRLNQDTAVTVTTGASEILGGPDGAASGEKYLTVDRTRGGAIRVAEFSEPIDPSKQSFSIEWADWGLGTFTAYSVGETDGTKGATKGLLSSFGVHSVSSGSQTRFVSFNSSKMGGTTTLDLPYKFEQWNTMRFAWDAETGQATLTANGTTVKLKTHEVALPATVDRFFFRGNADGSVLFIDAVTETAFEAESASDQE